MGGQLTKEQAGLAFGYTSVNAARHRNRMTGLPTNDAIIIRQNNLLTTDGDQNFMELNSHLQQMSPHFTLMRIGGGGETASIATAGTDSIVQEIMVGDIEKEEEDNGDDDDDLLYVSNDGAADDRVCCYTDGHRHESIPPGLNAIRFSDLPSLTNIGLCQLGLVQLSPNICFLFTTTSLQICCNELTSIPAEIGYMKSLTTLDVSKNRLQSVPDTIGFLHKLSELKLSENQLTSIPSSIGSLKKLGSLSLDSNRLTELPPEIGQIKTLVNLDVSDNPITVLPAEIGRLQYLRKLRIERCPLQTEFVHDLSRSPPSLMELAARTIVRRQIPILKDTTEDLKDYLASAKKCSFCEGPYFESYVKRGKIIEKGEHQIPLEYRLCCPHWNTEQERVSLLFCPLPDTAPSVEPYRLSSSNDDEFSSPPVTNNENDDGDATISRRSSTLPPTTMTRSLTIPISSLTRAPSLPSLPRSASSRSKTSDDPSQQQEEKGVNSTATGNNNSKKNNGSKRSGIYLWRSRRNNSASAILGKPIRSNSTTPRLSSRLRL